MEEKKMTEKESLELITTMIQRTRERYVGDGNIMLMWGYLTVAVTALVWILLATTGATREPAHCGSPSGLSVVSPPPSWTRSNGINRA